MTAFGKDNFDECNQWRLNIKGAISDIDYGVAVINPNDHFNFLNSDEYESEREIMEYDLYQVKDSDLIICNFNDPKSIGSACELAIAHEKRIPIIGLNEEHKNIHPWLKEFCIRIFDDIDYLIAYIDRHYINDD